MKDIAFHQKVIREVISRMKEENIDLYAIITSEHADPITDFLQRGGRMGQTAKKFGDELTMQTYLAYGEWAPAPGETEVENLENSPSAVWHVKKCPWYDEWAEQDMIEVGSYYCRFIDRALVRGYHPEIELDTGAVLTNGDPYCYFKWTGADMTDEHKAENAAIEKKVGTSRLKTWAFHIGHIYKTMHQVIEADLGALICSKIYQKVDQQLEMHFDKSFVELLHDGMLLDYSITHSLEAADRLKDEFEN